MDTTAWPTVVNQSANPILVLLYDLAYLLLQQKKSFVMMSSQWEIKQVIRAQKLLKECCHGHNYVSHKLKGKNPELFEKARQEKAEISKK